MANFRIRNVLCDYYLELPNELSRLKHGDDVKDMVPVMRIFGITDSGIKCCVHIHGVLPYIMFRSGSRLTDELRSHIESVVQSVIDQSSAGIPPIHFGGGIYGISEEKARSIYGFYPDKEYFVRVNFCDPKLAKLSALAFAKECVDYESLQPFSAHVPFILQFFVDFSISGMDFVHISRLYERLSPSNTTQKSLGDYVNRSPLEPSTNMLEFDVFADDIMNPLNSSQCTRENQGLEFIWREELRRCEAFGNEVSVNSPGVFGQPHVKTDTEVQHLAKLGQILRENSLQRKSNTPDSAPTQSTSNYTQRFSMSQRVVQELQDEGRWSREFSEEADIPLEIVEENELIGLQEDEVSNEQEIITLDENAEMESVDEQSDCEEDIMDTDSPENIWSKTMEPKTSEVRLPTNDSTIAEMDNSRYLTDESYGSFVRTEKINETWHGCDTFGDFPSQFDHSTKMPVKPLTDCQKEAERLIRSINSNVDNLCVISMECLSMPPEIRPVPEPSRDPVLAVFFSISKDVCNSHMNSSHAQTIMLSRLRDSVLTDDALTYVNSEEELFHELSELVQRHDPDILMGYDTTRFSWGYLTERASILKLPFVFNISRTRVTQGLKTKQSSRAPYGRIQLEVWSVACREVALRSYTFSSLVQALLNKRFPSLSSVYIKKAINANVPGARLTIFRHFLTKTKLNIDVFVNLGVFVRTSQMARVYGIQFTEVLNRGSQFRVESILLRLAKRYKFVAPSVSPVQRNKMDAPETLPLNLEPESGIYRDPVVVLDFQALYPSICIAYNYCYTTCLGKISNLQSAVTNNCGSSITLGALDYQTCSIEKIKELLSSEALNVSPMGGVFVKSSVRQGLLGIMLSELLETRVMVKRSIKIYREHENLLKILEARQLALKLVANVTYGYTAANWSGRMPCEELADAILSKARETLERAIKLVTDNAEHYGGARVIYGDTDSIFILFKDRTKAEAFSIGSQIAHDITISNPYPVKMKFEKVMQPSVLLSKKRYVGMSYESVDQKIGIFDAKGIETVRRDSCLLVAKTMERFLKLLFDMGVDASLQYVRYQLLRLRELPAAEFVLSKAYRAHYSEKSVIPMKKIASEMANLSDRYAPIRGERLSYLIVKPDLGTEKFVTITSCAVSMERYLKEPRLEIHYNYYISKLLIPTLTQVLQHVPIKLKWQSIGPSHCLACFAPNRYPWCDSCAKNSHVYTEKLLKQMRIVYRVRNLQRICFSCLSPSKSIDLESISAACSSHDCAVKKSLSVSDPTLIRRIIGGSDRISLIRGGSGRIMSGSDRIRPDHGWIRGGSGWIMSGSGRIRGGSDRSMAGSDRIKGGSVRMRHF
uniref:DNA polymerase n=1 Tax=Ditylenchus dipsaci TaxID=166011 RepID=A0A915CSK1_9BILA